MHEDFEVFLSGALCLFDYCVPVILFHRVHLRHFCIIVVKKHYFSIPFESINL